MNLTQEFKRFETREPAPEILCLLWRPFESRAGRRSHFQGTLCRA